MRRAVLAATVVAGLAMTDAAEAQPSYTMLDFEDLNGWEQDDHAAALGVFLETCGDMQDPDWSPLCALAQTQPDAKTFFELFFRPVLIEDGAPGLFTGYFEPELKGSRVRTGRFRYPLYRTPPELDQVEGPWLTRAEIEDGEAMAERGLEIAWVDDPVDVFFLQIQGSGRIRLQDGSTVRVGYGAANRHPYRSIGEELVRRGTFDAHEVSAQVIRNWVASNPEDGKLLLRHNPSYVFFREVNGVSSDRGPLGAMNRSISKGRTLAVDPAFVRLGAPVWIEKDGKTPMRRLMIAQDTGSAIKGAQRGDIFFGTGSDAGREAGKIKDAGRMIVLMPIQRAFAYVPGGPG